MFAMYWPSASIWEDPTSASVCLEPSATGSITAVGLRVIGCSSINKDMFTR